jgi:hypothetical protein
MAMHSRPTLRGSDRSITLRLPCAACTTSLLREQLYATFSRFNRGQVLWMP